MIKSPQHRNTQMNTITKSHGISIDTNTSNTDDPNIKVRSALSTIKRKPAFITAAYEPNSSSQGKNYFDVEKLREAATI